MIIETAAFSLIEGAIKVTYTERIGAQFLLIHNFFYWPVDPSSFSLGMIVFKRDAKPLATMAVP